MQSARRICLLAVAAGAAITVPAFAATPDPTPSDDVLMVQAAPDAIHFRPDSGHAKYSWLVGGEWQRPSRWLAGYAYFNNSFDQKSHYIYGGRWWPLHEGDPGWYFKLTGGLILGYKGPHEDKIPFNHNGVAPGLIPGLGFKAGRANVQFNLLGTAGMMITFGYDLPR